MSDEQQARSLSLLYQRHRNELLAFLTRKVRCRETARDLTQDTFVRLLHSEHGHVGNLRAFLYGLSIPYRHQPEYRPCSSHPSTRRQRRAGAGAVADGCHA
ncbi:hypothetical protein IR008_13245 [Pseudomonas putida]|nr:hypothetical protein [Pseudomonas putida]